MKFDYCTIMTNKNEHDFLEPHINSLKKHNPNDTFNLRISLVQGDDEGMECCSKFPEIDILPLEPYIQGGEGAKQCSFDTSNRMDKLVESSSEDWVILSHLDIFHIKPMIDHVRDLLDEKHSVIGIWPHGCTIINRRIYDQFHFKFWPINALQAVVHPDNIGVTLFTHIMDPNEPIVGVEGVDVGMMIVLESRTYGYEVDINAPATCYRHVGGLSFSHDEGNKRRDRALKMCEEVLVS